MAATATELDDPLRNTVEQDLFRVSRRRNLSTRADMSETVWISKAPLDSRLLLPVTSDLEEPKGLINYWKANNAAESLDPSCPTEIWVKDDSSGDINKLPDLSLIRTSWILSQRLADVFRRFDLGKGGIEPVRAFKMDHHTPLAGQYFCLGSTI
jgi:hypothetical protein